MTSFILTHRKVRTNVQWQKRVQWFAEIGGRETDSKRAQEMFWWWKEPVFWLRS
jgi:hypothetical protein